MVWHSRSTEAALECGVSNRFRVQRWSVSILGFTLYVGVRNLSAHVQIV